MSAIVSIRWYWIDYDPTDTKTTIKNRLLDVGAIESQFDRAVYVIRMKAPFGIAYPKGHTPTLYIGEGKIISRLDAHREWAKRFQSLGYKFPLEVACAFPRVKKNYNAYREFEAHLLQLFFNRYDTLPLKNSIHENKHYDHAYGKIATHGIIGPGSGSSHTWAIQPLPANSFRTVFQRTHAT